MIWLFANRNHELKNEDIDEIDNSLCMEIRNGQGYLRLGNRDEMQCIDHSENIKINYCPFCGRELMRKEEE